VHGGRVLLASPQTQCDSLLAVAELLCQADFAASELCSGVYSFVISENTARSSLRGIRHVLLTTSGSCWRCAALQLAIRSKWLPYAITSIGCTLVMRQNQ